jgi:hypothetical protein
MIEFSVNQVGQGVIVFRVAIASLAATVTALKTGSTAWQQFSTDANTGVCINLAQPGAVGSALANFSWKLAA